MSASNNVIRIENIAMTKNADNKTQKNPHNISYTMHYRLHFFEALLMKTCIVMFYMFLHNFFLLIYGPPSKMFCLFTFSTTHCIYLHLAFIIERNQDLFIKEK